MILNLYGYDIVEDKLCRIKISNCKVLKETHAHCAYIHKHTYVVDTVHTTQSQYTTQYQEKTSFKLFGVCLYF